VIQDGKPHHERENERDPADDNAGRPAQGATAKDLKGISAVPTESDKHGKGGGAHPTKTPGDEVDPGVG
jgi:hypothetical protein